MLDDDVSGRGIHSACVGLDKLKLRVLREAFGKGLHNLIEGNKIFARGHPRGGNLKVEVIGGADKDQPVVRGVRQLRNDMAEQIVGDAEAGERASENDNVVIRHGD